jgi:two-component system sensor histidine kinase DesK
VAGRATAGLRGARGTHDLLGFGLSAMKSDLAGRLSGRDDARTSAEITGLARICAAARADLRLVTGETGTCRSGISSRPPATS